MTPNLNYRSFLSDQDDNQLRQALSIVYIYAFITHIVFLFSFRHFGVKPMEYINYISPLLYLVALYYNYKNVVITGAIIAFNEAIIHGGLSAVFVGWEANFHFYVILVYLLIFFLYNVNIFVRGFLAIFTTASYVYLYLYSTTYDPLYSLPDKAIKIAGVVNIVNTAAVLSLFALAYSHFIRKNIQRLEEAEELQKVLNAQKNKFFSIFSHDLKNPISSIHGFLNLLIDRYDNMDKEKQIKHLKQINAAVDDTYKLVNNLLEWSKSQMNNLKITPEEIFVQKSFESIKQLLDHHAAAKEITIQLDSNTNHKVFADEQTFQSILRNLVSNAIKFTNKKGIVSITSKSIGDNTLIEVSDNGIGMTKERQKEIFSIEKEYSVIGTANERGTGIGLIVVKDFVEKNNGTLSFHSKVNEGTTFSILLPSK